MKKIKRFLKILFEPSEYGDFFSGSKKILMKTPVSYQNGRYVKLANNEIGICFGPWYHLGKWDGSYVINVGNRVAYLYPSKFELTNVTVKDKQLLVRMLDSLDE